MILYNFTNNKLRHTDQFSNCCGSRFYASSTKERKWKNQYGEGVIPEEEVNLRKKNTLGICLTEGFVDEEGAYLKGTINHIKTKNGKITIGIRERV